MVGEYTYNSEGRRVEKNVPANGITVFHYDVAGRLIEETSANGQVIADYVYLGRSPLAMIKPVAGREYVYFYHNDHLGSPKFMTDQNENVVWTGSFDPLGIVISAGGSITNNLRFSGQYFDNETGLDYNGYRYYDPSIGSYTRPDPVGLVGGMNRYVYVQNDPVNLIDPFGLRSYGAIVGVNLTAITGVEGSASIVWNTGLTPGEEFDVGLQFSGGIAAGLNVGGSAGLQTYNGNIQANDGPGLNISGGAWYIAGNVTMNGCGKVTGGSLGVSTPTRIQVGLSIGYDDTQTFSIRHDIIPAIDDFFASPAY
jgi:RHS repeat-associated protein